MGAWGPAVFSDDTAADVRSAYRELLEDEVPDLEATSRVVAAYRQLDADDQPVFWLALAAAQSQVGRLDDQVKARALDVIDSGQGLERWQEAGPKQLARRVAALAKLREQLTGPQPPRKALRRPWRHETDLRPGDVLSFTASTGAVTLLRVARIDDHRLGAAPVLEWLDWHGTERPGDRTLRRLRARKVAFPGLGGPAQPDTYRVARFRAKDADWRDAGFVLATHVKPARRAARTRDGWHLGWSQLVQHIESEVTT